MVEGTKLNFTSNVLGIMSVLYMGFVAIITFFFKNISSDILKTTIPIFLIIALIALATIVAIDYFKERFLEVESTMKRVKKLEDNQRFDSRFRKIEEKLISVEHKTTRMFSNKKGNMTFNMVLLAIVLIALIAWFVWIFSGA